MRHTGWQGNKSLILAKTPGRYPQQAWIHVVTDGSATNAMINGEAGIHSPGGQRTTASMAVGKRYSNYRTETEAFMEAAFIVQASDHNYKQVIVPPDDLSVLQAYQNHKLPNLASVLQHATATGRTVLWWIPAHCGISGNEHAGILVEKDARREQHVNNVNFDENKTLLRAVTMPSTKRGDYHITWSNKLFW